MISDDEIWAGVYGPNHNRRQPRKVKHASAKRVVVNKLNKKEAEEMLAKIEVQYKKAMTRVYIERASYVAGGIAFYIATCLVLSGIFKGILNTTSLNVTFYDIFAVTTIFLLAFFAGNALTLPHKNRRK